MATKQRKRATVTDITGGLRLSLSVLAREMGVSRDKLRDMIHRAKVQPAGDRSGHPIYHLRDAFRLLSVPAENVDPATLTPFERQAYWRAESEKMRAMEQARELVPRIEVEQEFARIVKITVRCFETLPDRIERDTGAPGLIIDAIERCVDEVRNDLHNSIADSSLSEYREGHPAPADAEATA